MRLLPLRTISCRFLTTGNKAQLLPAKKASCGLSGHFKSYKSVLQRCVVEKSIAKTRAVHNHMKQTGFPHLSLGNKLIDAYLNCGSVDEARQVFDDMLHPHVVSWNSLISAYIRLKRSQDAVLLYRKMFMVSILPDEFTFSSIFKAFSDLKLVNGGRATHGHLVVLGLEGSNMFMSSALVDMYAKLGMLQEALFTYESISDKDVVLATALIVGYTQNGEDLKALGIFEEMLNCGIRANDFTFASVLIACGNLENLSYGRLIHGLILRSGFHSRIAPATSLISMYSKCFLVEDSLKIFNEIVNPNTVAWTAMIGCLLHGHREEEALQFLLSMIRSSVKPNAFTLSTALRGCATLALFELVKQIHASVVKLGLETNRYISATLIDSYGKSGHVGIAGTVFDSLVFPDLVSVNSLIYGYAQDGDGMEAIRLFYMIKGLGVEPNNATYVNVLSACSNSGMLEEGRQVFSLLVADHKPGPSTDHYACMVDLLGRAGRLHEAAELIARVQKPDKILWRTLLGACKIHGEVNMAQWAADKVLELDPGDDATYILLSNVYASLGQWKEVTSLKCLIRERKLKKDPAVSWIHVNQEIHTFMAGDMSHAKSELIYEELKDLVEKTKGLGYVPDTRFVLQDMDEFEKERSLIYHSEKLAVAYGVLSSSGKACNPITIFKNLRVCGDCHNWIKLVTKVIGKEIIARDAKRFHKFRDGLCSCRDYW